MSGVLVDRVHCACLLDMYEHNAARVAKEGFLQGWKIPTLALKII